MRETTLTALVIVLLWAAAVSNGGPATYHPLSKSSIGRPGSYIQPDKSSRGTLSAFSPSSAAGYGLHVGTAGGRVGGPLLTGRRDPFRLPPVSTSPSANTKGLSAPLPSGPGGLLIQELTLKGVLWDGTGQTEIAIVTNKTQEVYFLHPNEAVYDGVVTRITPDAIYFKQRIAESGQGLGFRTVVKRLSGVQGE
jgi:hypothetical protein